jgi:protein-L-isoaspartate(D-aspartate) O-methyltransferase
MTDRASHNGADSLASARERMLALLRRHIRDGRVIDAMASIPRERFVPERLGSRAYDDNALPIGEGQTISQPLIVALMVEALRLSSADRVLEVGTGSGYAAAVLSRLASEVITVERIADLSARARQTLHDLHLENVRVETATNELGYKQAAPYDAILVSAGAPHVPRTLLDQLADGGRLVVPIGSRRQQELVRATATPHGIELTRIGPCAFVPLVGDDAWENVGDRVSRRPNVP